MDIYGSASIIIGIIGLIIGALSIIFLYKARRYKEITYTEEVFPLLKIENEVKSKLKILYEETSIQDLSLFKLTLFSSGTQDIVKEDFSKPLNVEFNSDALIIKTDMINKNPNYIHLSWSSGLNHFILQPMLFKINQSFTCQFLISNYKNYSIIDSLINTKIKELKRNVYTYLSIWFSIIMLITVMVLTLLTSLYQQILIPAFYDTIVILSAIAMLSFLLPMLWDKEYREKMFALRKK